MSGAHRGIERRIVPIMTTLSGMMCNELRIDGADVTISGAAVTST